MFKSTISEIVDRERIKPAKINEQSQVLKNLVDLRAAYNKALSLKREQ